MANINHHNLEMGLYTIRGLLDEHWAIITGTPATITFLTKSTEKAFEIGENFLSDYNNAEGYIIYNPAGEEIFSLYNGDELGYIEPEYKNLALSKISWLSKVLG